MGIDKKLKAFQRQYLRSGARKRTNMALVLARIWTHLEPFGICLTRTQMITTRVAEMLGTKEQASLDIFLEVENMDFEYELAFAAAGYSARSS